MADAVEAAQRAVRPYVEAAPSRRKRQIPVHALEELSERQSKNQRFYVRIDLVERRGLSLGEVQPN
jgi:hypothetical protein